MATRPQKQAAQLKQLRKAAKTRAKRKELTGNERCCGLCGATKNLTRTECCGQWICDDEHTYELFSYARNSCSRNHRRYTLCAHHFNEEHEGRWQDCAKCRDDIEPEMYVYYGTNEYNFEVLADPPPYEATRCAACNAVIVLADGGYSHGREGYLCSACTAAKYPDLDR